MIVFLYGEDSYRRLERKNFYAAEFHKKYGIRPADIDLAEPEGFAVLEEAARGQSLFAPRKLLVLRNISAAEPKKLLPLLKMSLESKTSGILISEDKKPVKTLDVLLKKPVIAEEFPKLKGQDWLKFVQGVAKKAGAKLTPAGAAFLAEAWANDSWGVATELRKLAHIASAASPDDLMAMGVRTEKDYWAVLNGIRAPHKAVRLAALQEVFWGGEPAAKTFNMLAALWTPRIGDFAAYDKAVKFGRMDYEEALVDLALSA